MTRNFKAFAVAAALAVAGAAAAWAGVIEWQKVESSWLERVGYDAETKTLLVRMLNSSDVYEYSEVPEEVFRELLAAESKGAYFATKIQDEYPTVRR